MTEIRYSFRVVGEDSVKIDALFNKRRFIKVITEKIEATYQVRHFVFINNGFSGIKVYHNGELFVENNVILAPDKYVLYTSVNVDRKRIRC
jgi:hypothetical protein